MSRKGQQGDRTRLALPKKQRVAAYAIIIRDEKILLSRLAPWLSETERWTLPGGGIEHGEHPRLGVVREVFEETGLHATVGDTARVYSVHRPEQARRDGHWDIHGLRIVYDGWVPADSPEPEVQEVDGTTVDAKWIPLTEIYDGTRAVVPLVDEALATHETHVLQRVAAYGVAQRKGGSEVLLTRISERGYSAGLWTLPGGGIDQGESPPVALAREFYEETGLKAEVGGLLGVHHEHVIGAAPSGRWEDFHGVHLMFAVNVAEDATPQVVEVDGTTDQACWQPWSRVVGEHADLPIFDLVRAAHEVKG